MPDRTIRDWGGKIVERAMTEDWGEAMTQPSTPTVVTVQQWQPLLIALLRGLVFAVVGSVTGLVAVLQTNTDASIRQLLVGAVIGGGVAFATRATEGLADQGRASTVDSSTRIRDVTPGTDTTGVTP